MTNLSFPTRKVRNYLIDTPIVYFYYFNMNQAYKILYLRVV